MAKESFLQRLVIGLNAIYILAWVIIFWYYRGDLSGNSTPKWALAIIYILALGYILFSIVIAFLIVFGCCLRKKAFKILRIVFCVLFLLDLGGYIGF